MPSVEPRHVQDGQHFGEISRHLVLSKLKWHVASVVHTASSSKRVTDLLVNDSKVVLLLVFVP